MPALFRSVSHFSRAQARADSSVGTDRDRYDNALAETLVGLCKTEMIRPRGPRRTPEAMECATLERVDSFNHRRQLKPIGDVPWAEPEQSYYREPNESPTVA